MQHWSLYVLSPRNPLRRAARWLVHQPWFDRTIDVCIVVNCVSLALRDTSMPVVEGVCSLYSPDPIANTILLVLDVAFTSIFCIESVLKIIVYGAILHRGAYLRDGWNWIDFSVALVSFLAQLPTFCMVLGGLSAFRAVRLLRTLRSIRSFRAMAATVQALIDAAPKLLHVGVLLLFTFLCFGILGAQLFSGSLRGRCHVYAPGFGVPGDLLLADALTPCNGQNKCAGLQEAVYALTDLIDRSRTPVYTFSNNTCESPLTKTKEAIVGDLFCCVPRLPPAERCAPRHQPAEALPLA